jgi:hypothetical protein
VTDTVDTSTITKIQHEVAKLVEALHYKPEGRKFNYRCCHWNLFHVHVDFEMVLFCAGEGVSVCGGEGVSFCAGEGVSLN